MTNPHKNDQPTTMAANRPLQQASPTLQDLATTLHEPLPQELIPFLNAHGIHTLADIRTAGGISQLQGLPATADNSVVNMLDAQASLSVLSPEVQLNTILINKGYTNIRAIAEAPRSEFIKAIRDHIGDFKAAQLHVQARAQARFLDNVLVGIRTNAANGYKDPNSFAKITQGLSQTGCDCKDCESAISPLAYLYDLMTYAQQHLKYFKAPFDTMPSFLQFLSERFHQPFGDLVTSCSETDKQVRQVRICIEVLRSYLITHPPTTTLDAAEKTYLAAAYTTLLKKIGTSYEEIRLARTDKAEKRQALADRLGIELGTTRPDHLDHLFLDLSTSTEQNLEVLFGLVDTTRDPLSTGAKLGDSSPAQITRWVLYGVRWKKNTDLDGSIYVSLKHPTSSTWRVELYRDNGRTSLVASGELSSASDRADVSPENNSGLSGSLSFANYADSNTIKISAVPSFLSWQLQQLRTLWEEQDRPTDAYSEGSPSPGIGGRLALLKVKAPLPS